MISVQNLMVGYAGQAILEHINFEVRRGEVFAILGKTGSGKSTLLKSLIGLYTPREGEVLIEGTNIGSVEPAKTGHTGSAAKQFKRTGGHCDAANRRVKRGLRDADGRQATTIEPH